MKQLILITGATGGVGTSVCKYLAGRNWDVLAVARSQRLLTELCDGTSGITPYIADLADPVQVEQVLDRLVTDQGYIPYVINNAGMNVAAPVTALGSEDLQESIQVNAMAPFRIMQRLLPRMVEAGFGRIINITSGAPLNCFPGYSAYSASKAALNALTVTAAKEYAQHDIRINLMSPGPVRSKMAPNAPMDPAVCFPTLDFLLSLEADGPTGRFFWLGYEIPLFPELQGIHWLEGKADPKFRRVL